LSNNVTGYVLLNFFMFCRWCCWNMLWRRPSSCHDAPSRALHTAVAMAVDTS